MCHDNSVLTFMSIHIYREGTCLKLYSCLGVFFRSLIINTELDVYLVRDVVPVKVEGLHVVVLRQNENAQVVAGSAGKQENHRCAQCYCATHCGPLCRYGKIHQARLLVKSRDDNNLACDREECCSVHLACKIEACGMRVSCQEQQQSGQ